VSGAEPPERPGRGLFTALAVVQALAFAALVGWLIWRVTGG